MKRIKWGVGCLVVVVSLVYLFSDAYTQTGAVRGKRTRDLEPLQASDITDDDAILFNIDKTDQETSLRFSLAELKSTVPQARNIDQYGAVPDDGNDDTAAIQAAVDATPSGASLFIPEGQYVLSGVDVIRPIHIYGPGVLCVPVNKYGFDISLDADWSNSKDVTADTTYQPTALSTFTVTQLTVPSHGFSQGDIVKVLATTTYSAGVGSGFHAELAKIEKVVDADTIVLDHALDADQTGFWAYVRKLPAGRVVLDLNFDWVAGGSTTDRNAEGSENGPLVSLSGAIDPIVRITALHAYSTVFRGRSLYRGYLDINAAEIDKARESTNQYNVEAYGVLLEGACARTEVTGNMSGGRAGCYVDQIAGPDPIDTSTTTMVNAGCCRAIRFIGAAVSDAAYAGYCVNGGARDCEFINCSAVNLVSLDETSTVFVDMYGFITSCGGNFRNCLADGCKTGYYFGAAGSIVGLRSPPSMTGCRDDHCVVNGIEYDDGDGYPGVIDSHVSNSPCQFLLIDSGKLLLRNCHVSTTADFNDSAIEISTGGRLQCVNLSVIGGTDAEPVFYCSGTNAQLWLRGMLLDRVLDTDPVALFTVAAACDLTVNMDSSTFLGWEMTAGEADGVAAFPAQGLVASASAGTLSIVHDAWGKNGVRHEFGTAAPVAEYHRVGDILWHTTPAAGGNIGWVCTATGTPGTWKSFGSIAP